MGRRDKTIVGLDIGSTKICTLIAAAHNGGMECVGFGKVDSKGLKKGVVVNLEATVEAIKRSVHEAEMMAGSEVDRVFVGLAGRCARTAGQNATKGATFANIRLKPKITLPC